MTSLATPLPLVAIFYIDFLANERQNYLSYGLPSNNFAYKLIIHHKLPNLAIHK